MWDVIVIMKNEVTNLVDIIATRTDVVTGEIWRYPLCGLINTPAQRAGILNKIKNAYRAKVAKDDRVIIALAGLADTAINSLNSWDEV